MFRSAIVVDNINLYFYHFCLACFITTMFFNNYTIAFDVDTSVHKKYDLYDYTHKNDNKQ